MIEAAAAAAAQIQAEEEAEEEEDTFQDNKLDVHAYHDFAVR